MSTNELRDRVARSELPVWIDVGSVSQTVGSWRLSRLSDRDELMTVNDTIRRNEPNGIHVGTRFGVSLRMARSSSAIP